MNGGEEEVWEILKGFGYPNDCNNQGPSCQTTLTERALSTLTNFIQL